MAIFDEYGNESGKGILGIRLGEPGSPKERKKHGQTYKTDNCDRNEFDLSCSGGAVPNKPA